MKNFKRVLSLALAALMVIGGLVIAPVDAKADDTTYTRVYDVKDFKDGGDVLLVAKYDDKYYALGSKFGKKMNAVEVTVANDQIVGSELPVWTLTKKETPVEKYEVATYTLNIGTSYLGHTSGSNFTTITSGDATEWILSEKDDMFTLVSSSDTTRAIGFRQESGKDPVFGPYGKSNATNSQYSFDILVFKSGTVTSAADDVDTVLTAEITTEAQVIEALKAHKAAGGTGNIKDPGTGNETFELTGKIVSVDTPFADGKITVTISCSADETVKINCYNLQKGTIEDVSNLTVGDTITVKGSLKVYEAENYSYSFNYGPLLEAYTAAPTGDEGDSGSEGDSSSESESGSASGSESESGSDVKLTQKEIVDAAYALKEGDTLAGGPYTLTGVITEITEISTDYKNATFTIVVEGKDIVCFRLKGDNYETIEVGDTVTVTGELVNWYGTIEFTSGGSIDTIVKKGDLNSMAIYMLLLAGCAFVAVGVASKKKMA